MTIAALAGGRAAPEAPNRTADRAEVRRAAEAFESMLLETLIQSLTESGLEDGFFGSSTGSSQYQGMLQRNLAQHFSQNSPLGLADVLEERWLRRLENPESADDASRLSPAHAAGRYRDVAEVPEFQQIRAKTLKILPAAPIPSVVEPRAGKGDSR